jgi:hypothetical protein
MACILPPLILHPFADASGPGKLVDASRASLALSGVIPAGPEGGSRLEERLMVGRYCEISMLFYLGKDLQRWVAQCMDFVERTPSLQDTGIRPGSFAALLVEDPPSDVRRKLQEWGVQDYSAIFGRAFGLHVVFDSLPAADSLTPDFVRYYHHYADGLFSCHQRMFTFPRISSEEFDFQLYASGEYTRMLERQWGAV